MNYKKALKEKIEKSKKLAMELNEQGINAIANEETGEISMTFPEDFEGYRKKKCE